MDSKPQRPEAVVFDLDGTLADTVLDLAAALNRTLESLISRRIRRRPCERWSAADWRSCWTGASPLMVRRSMATSLAGQKLFDRYPASPTVHSSLYPGTASALGALREAGVALRICTNKPDAIARDLLQTLGLAHAFGVIQGGEEGMRKSPTRAGMRRVLQELGTAPSASFMVGDSVTDVETARAAGLAGIIVVSYGYTAIPARALGADAVIDHLDGLPAAVCVSPPPKAECAKDIKWPSLLGATWPIR